MSGTDLALERSRARLGQLLNGKWQLQSILGTGGMATVFAAVHRNKKRAAIKMLHPELSLSSNIRERFLREGYVANSIDHPGVVRVDDDDVAEDGAAYIVMELLRGEPVDARADRLGGTLPLEEVGAITDQLLSVLVAAHAAGVVHRDLKPENLFLTTDGQLKVLDFGIARLREVSGRSSTSIGSFMGTPAFMSPEQARGRWDEVDERSDIWAVGATMYSLLTGFPVHDAETVNDQLVLAATTDAPSVRGKRPDLPEPVIALVDRALARKAEDRWPNAAAMQAELRSVLPPAAKLDLRTPEQEVPRSAVPKVVAPIDRTTNPTDATLVSARGTATAVSARGTAAAVSTSVPVHVLSTRRGGRGGLLLAATVGAVVVLGGVLLRLRSSEPAPDAGAARGASASPVAASAEPVAAPSASAAPALAGPTGTPAASAPPAAPSATSEPMRSPAPAAKHKALPRTSAPTPAAAPAPAPKPASDPFDRRY